MFLLSIHEDAAPASLWPLTPLAEQASPPRATMRVFWGPMSALRLAVGVPAAGRRLARLLKALP